MENDSNLFCGKHAANVVIKHLVARFVSCAHMQEIGGAAGSMLVFLPGWAEIQKVGLLQSC
eukprot:3723299-Amphidinium_carterae.1